MALQHTTPAETKAYKAARGARTSADRLVNDITAFHTFQELLDVVIKEDGTQGYVPTLRRNRKGNRLAAILEGMGLRTFRIG
jgi:hypothetical protein